MAGYPLKIFKIKELTIMKLRSMFTILMMMCLPLFTIAQDPDPEPVDNTGSAATEIGGEVMAADASATEPGDLPPAPVGVPIDGGLTLLLAAGVGYGVKKYREKRSGK